MTKGIKILIIGLVLFLIASLYFVYYFYSKTKLISNDSRALSEVQVSDVVNRVSKHIILPQGETPTLATVSDPSQLQGQAFFAKAKKGDQVLVYINAKKAILYDPVQDKIIDIAPINVTPQVDTSTLPKESVSEPVVVPKATKSTSTNTKKK
jgi:hypothetical protein